MENFDYTISIGQLGEQLTLNQWVLGSSPRWRTKRKPYGNVGLFSYVCAYGKATPGAPSGLEQLGPAAYSGGQKRSGGPFLERGSLWCLIGRKGGCGLPAASTKDSLAQCAGLFF